MSVTTAENHHVENIIELLRTWTEYADDLSVASGETYTLDSGTRERYGEVSNAGTITNAGTLASGVDPWTDTVPEIRPYWEDAQAEKGPGADQPPVAYVWSPVDSSLERFSVDDQYRVNNTVEIQFWSLDEQEPVTLLNDVIEIMSAYLDDNKIRTPYTDVQPTAASDFREQKQARVTDHYLTSVEVDTDGLTTGGVV